MGADPQQMMDGSPMATPAATLQQTLGRDRRDWLTPVELLVLGAIWGGSFLFMRVAAPEFGVMPLVEVRLVLGAAVLLPFLWPVRRHFTWRRVGLLAAIGLLNSAIPFALFAWAAERAPAGIGAISNSLTVPAAALVAFLMFRERIGWLRGAAIAVGFTGVVVLASGRIEGSDVTGAAIAGTVAAILYGVAANVIRRHLTDLPAVAVAGATLSGAALLSAPFAIASWPTAPISGIAWASAVALGLLCTGIAYGVYFRLLKRIGAPRAVTVTYLVPLFGVGWSWWLLGETPSWQMAMAAALILGSVAVSQRAGR
jgi:drug/metabolite transporter (DMT)-like permease